MYTVHSIGGTCPKKHVDEKEKKIFSPFFLRVSPSLSVAFFLGCSDSQPHPRASDTVLNGRGQTRSRSPRYFATFQAFNLARVPLLAIVPMIVGWESLCARFVSSSSAPLRFYPVMHRPSLCTRFFLSSLFSPPPPPPRATFRRDEAFQTSRATRVRHASVELTKGGREIEGWNELHWPLRTRDGAGVTRPKEETGPQLVFRVDSKRARRDGISLSVETSSFLDELLLLLLFSRCWRENSSSSPPWRTIDR